MKENGERDKMTDSDKTSTISVTLRVLPRFSAPFSEGRMPQENEAESNRSTGVGKAARGIVKWSDAPQPLTGTSISQDRVPYEIAHP